MFSSHIQEDKSFVYLCFEGTIRYQDIITALQDTLVKEEYKNSFHGIIDFRDSEFKMSITEVKKLGTFARDNKVNSGVWAFLASTPHTTAFLNIYCEQLQGLHPIKVYSTMEGAAMYLGRDLSELNAQLAICKSKLNILTA